MFLELLQLSANSFVLATMEVRPVRKRQEVQHRVFLQRNTLCPTQSPTHLSLEKIIEIWGVLWCSYLKRSEMFGVISRIRCRSRSSQCRCSEGSANNVYNRSCTWSSCALEFLWATHRYHYECMWLFSIQYIYFSIFFNLSIFLAFYLPIYLPISRHSLLAHTWIAVEQYSGMSRTRQNKAGPQARRRARQLGDQETCCHWFW